MNRKLLFFDIDGTLLCGKLPGYIPASALEALKQAQERGHYLFINSGRALCYFPQPVMDYPFDGYVCGCGTHVVFHDRVLYHHIVPEEVRRRLPDQLRECGLQGVFEGTENLYADLSIKPFPPIKMIGEAFMTYSGDHVKDFTDKNLDFEKFIIIADQNSDLQGFYEKTGSYFNHFGSMNMSPYIFQEFVPKECTKAKGIEWIARELGMGPEDCYVFGDSSNDLDMMNYAGYSIAMGNSTPEALEAATYVTTPVDRDGIRNALLHYGLI